MKFAKDILQTNIDESKYDLEKYDKWWENDTLTEKEHYLDALGDGYKSLGIHTSFLEDEKSKKWFGKAAKNKNNRLRLELDDPSYFDDYNSSNLPAFYNRALNLALLSGNDEVIQKVGEDAYKMDEEYLEHWDDPIEIFQYYNAKLEASIILNNNTQQELLEKYRESLEKGEFKRGEISLGCSVGSL